MKSFIFCPHCQNDIAWWNSHFQAYDCNSCKWFGKPEDVIVEAYYQHYKGDYYQVLHIAYNCETQNKLVVYKALYDDFKVWVRPYKAFISYVDLDTPRFKLVKLPD